MDPSTPSKLSPRKRQRRPREYSEAEVRQILGSVLTSGDDVTQTVRQILEDCQSESTEPCRRVVFERCVELLNSDGLQSQMAKELVGKLLVELDSLNGGSLAGLMEQLIDGIKKGSAANGRSLELLPKTMAIIAAQATIRFQKEGGGSGEMEGSEYKSHLLNTLYSCKWAPSCVLHVANMCREIPMTSEELQFLIEKILRTMKSLSLSELPPLVYQLLVLSTKGHKTLVLEGILTLFNQLDGEVLAAEQEGEGMVAVNLGQDELLQTEGTVILHITFALKQDQELGKEFLKNLKAMQSRMYGSMLSPFSIALALSVARIHRFEDAVFDFLKGVVLRSFKDHDRKRASKWMKEVNQDSPDMERLVLDTVQHSICGWDHVVQGLVMLGFHLMDSFTARSSATSPTVSSTPQHRACCLGAKILQETFKVHPLVHREMVSQLINRILTNASAHVSHYITLLSDVVAAVPQVSLDSLPQLREAFSYLSLLPPTPAIELLHAILPLVQFSSSVRDSLLLVLRKSLFSRQIEARKVAVGGYLLLLRKFKVLSSLAIDGSQASQSQTGSQIQVEIHSAIGSSAQSGNEALCLEILAALRRCLTQQHEVRLSLYEGLYEVFCSNSKLAEPIIDLLLNHLQHYYESESDIIPPLKFEPCLTTSGGEVNRTEPLDHLLCCLQQCVAKFAEWEGRDEGVEDEPRPPEVIEEARDTLQSLAERMAKSEPEDFELDKSADFSSSSSVGQKNRAVARLVAGSYEALMEYVFATGEVSQASCEQTLRLHQGYQRVADILQEKAGGSGAGSKRSHSTSGGHGGLSKTDSCNLSLLCVTNMLRAVFSDAIPNHQQSLAVLRGSQALVKHLLSVALQKIHQIHDRGTCEGDSLHRKPEKIFKSCCSLGRVLFKQLDTGAAGGGQREGGKKGKSVPVLCLEGFVQLLQTVVGRFPGRTEAFLSSVNSALQEGASAAEKVHFFLKFFQRMVTAFLNGTTRGDWGMREIQATVGLIGLLANELDAESQELEQVYEWTHSQCKEQNVDDSQLTKALVSLLLTLTSRHKGSVKIIRKLSQDIHYHLGDIDEDIELECRTYFAIVNPRTASSSVLGLVYAQTETVLNNAEWLIGRLKSESTSNPVEDLFEGMHSSTLGTQVEGHCSSVCERLMNFVVAYHELVQTAIPSGPSSEGLLKTVTKLYTVLANLVKYYLSIYPQLCCVIPNLRKLVEMVGTHLSQQVYSLIAYIQSTQTAGSAEQQDSKGKKGGKGKPKAASAGKVMVRKETRSIPSLIFAMEQLEKFLIQLSKKSKVNLMENFKRSTSRDFRINHQTVEAILNDDGSFEEEEEDEGGIQSDESGGEEGGGGGPSNGSRSAPKAKKLKRS